jgi:hypothetical protein
MYMYSPKLPPPALLLLGASAAPPLHSVRASQACIGRHRLCPLSIQQIQYNALEYALQYYVHVAALCIAGAAVLELLPYKWEWRSVSRLYYNMTQSTGYLHHWAWRPVDAKWCK